MKKVASALAESVVARIAAKAAATLLMLASSALAQSGTGLTGQYYDTSTFTTLVTTRTFATANFDWGTSIPAGRVLID